jgi:hypothetical protein
MSATLDAFETQADIQARLQLADSVCSMESLLQRKDLESFHNFPPNIFLLEPEEQGELVAGPSTQKEDSASEQLAREMQELRSEFRTELAALDATLNRVSQQMQTLERLGAASVSSSQGRPVAHQSD